jgi:4-carboxymuconolactone decarboxylase
MSMTVAATLSVLAVASALAGAEKITVTRRGSRPANRGPAQYFTGSVLVEPLFDAKQPARTLGASVTFEPGARTAWHTHPLGQTLVVTAGVGRVQRWGDEALEIRPGDVVWIPPAQKHWHGAAPTASMTHIAILEQLDGKNADWMEPVTDEQYSGPVAAVARAASSAQTPGDPRSIAPAFARYNDDTLLGDVWRRPGLSPRDRGLVTAAALVARGQTVEMAFYFELALDSGVRPAELSELVTHLAFYAGWANATCAAKVAQDVLARRGVGADQLPAAAGPRLPLDEAREAQRAARVAEDFEKVAPGVVQYTTDVLFRDLWLRPGLAPRDRSLVTLSALVAAGHAAQIAFHLNRALDNGLTKAEASEALTQLAFYAGWPNVFSALPVVKSVLEQRP